jgi:Zn-finger nucleic acid-binding protein
MKPPIPAKFQGDMDKYKDSSVPDFNSLVNFPHHMNQKTSPAPDGTRNCVMCGHACPATGGGKQKGKNNCHPLADQNLNRSRPSGPDNSFATIPSQNKGLCTLCDVNVWIVLQSGLEIKWCKGCKNFRPWASFGEKGLATKCMRCRERQREKYALEKEKKERSKSGRSSSSSGRVMSA